MRVLLATSEAVPFIKTGGLADVSGTLVNEFKRIGVESSLVLPFYRKIKKKAKDFGIKPLGVEIDIPLGNNSETAGLWRGETPGGSPAYFIENDRFYNRDELYGTPEGDYPDNFSRFTFFNRAVCEAIETLELNVDIIHCNDWQTGLIPVYTRTLYKDKLRKTATLLTIHNIGYQGIFWSIDMPLTGLGWGLFSREGLEFHGKISFLKGGILFADLINAVSNNYAREIITSQYGFGLEGVLTERKNDLFGIMNGIDYNEWAPEKDRFIHANYSINDLTGKAECKKALQTMCGLPTKSDMLIGLVTRLSTQKGLDLVAASTEAIIRSGIQMVLLGKGDESFQKIFLSLQKKYRKQLSVNIGFDNALSHRVYAGSDVFLMPSKYEPCGLGQLIALRYGSVPVVRKTGGLVDTVMEYNPDNSSGTGFLFEDYSTEDMLDSIHRAHDFFKSKTHWINIQKNDMSQSFDWSSSAEQYLSLYEKALKKKTACKV
jgi:starch synthase